MSQLDRDTQTQLAKYITERGKREEEIFVLAEDNHALLRQDFLKQFTGKSAIDWSAKFNQYFYRWADGTVRNVPEGTAPESFDTERYPTAFVGRGVKLDADFQKRMVLSYDFVEKYAAGWRNRFLDTYISLPEGANIVLWPGAAWGIKAASNLHIPDEEWAYLGDYSHNPDRKTLWTGVYSDPVAQVWMVSAETPIDDPQGRHLGTIGHDIVLTNLLQRTINDRIEGAYNLLVRADGQLIAHPDWMERIQAEAGKLKVQTSGNPHLQRTFDFALKSQQAATVVYNSTDREYLAIAKLKGPDWYLITVYPQALLRQEASALSQFVLLLGLTSLLIEVILLYIVLRQKIAMPLTSLLSATRQLAKGDFDVQLDTQRQDELGQLATAFTHMSRQLQDSFTSLEKRVEERTAKLKEATLLADQANRAKSDFLANMSHELRTPLNGILGYAQILGRSKTLVDKEQQGVNIIYQCGTHLLNLINDILDLSKIEARKLELTPTALHLPSLLQSVVEMCNIRAEYKGIDFLYQPSSRLPEGIEADEKRLRQVLINLLGNAIKFTDRGSVTLRVDVLDRSHDQVSLLFQVIDTGVGIAETDRQKLFHAFEQVGDRQKQSEGTGLGLAISQRIVQLMGGTIQVNSKFGQGSEFYFTVTLPLAEDWVEQQGTLANGDRMISYHGEKHRILVVDDRWENRAVLINLLEPLGFTLLEAENGQEGLDQIQSNQPDLVITDIAMPVMDGLELLKQIRQSDQYKHLKMIVSSASVAQADQQMAIQAGGNDFLPKPVPANLLFQLLEKHLHLTWIYETSGQADENRLHSDSTEVLLPSFVILEELLTLAQKGRFKKFTNLVTDVQQQDSRYQVFTENILQLAQQYQFEKIEEQLKMYLKKQLKV
ncbi:hybrid sensor histidine kinase/response regulator [Alkalinema sp. FACHB-956]|uniref:hybrid sensor histidine kinase/response regulator n=1 Tax=Alkalinema sp. FACHB-956 TaxID=2692768 RepID=UPI0016828994|nr:hybrid sensor histidine kinase/response regulator [Alkalinema sp. FACHB-956]MBD2326320.1 response regulator [Alkalinema sp. FACHB-956]